jgi:hypothetical protein
LGRMNSKWRVKWGQSPQHPRLPLPCPSVTTEGGGQGPSGDLAQTLVIAWSLQPHPSPSASLSTSHSNPITLGHLLWWWHSIPYIFFLSGYLVNCWPTPAYYVCSLVLLIM